MRFSRQSARFNSLIIGTGGCGTKMMTARRKSWEAIWPAATVGRMLNRETAAAALKTAMRPAPDLALREDGSREEFESLVEADLLANVCEPFEVIARDGSGGRGLPEAPIYCVARRRALWLLYQPDDHRFFRAHGWIADDLHIILQATPLAGCSGRLLVNPQRA